MNAMTHLLGIILLIAACPFVGTRVQAQTPKPAKAQPPLMVRFVYISTAQLPNGQPEPDLRVSLDSGTGIHDLVLGPGGLSPIIEYRGPQPVTLFQKVKKGKNEVRKTLTSQTFPPTWKGVFFLVSYNPALAPFPYQFTPIEFWGGDIADKHVRFYNLCPGDLEVNLAGSHATIAPQHSVDLDVHNAIDYMPIKNLAKRNEDGRPVAVKTGLPKPSDLRLLMLAYPMTPEFNNISLLTIADLPMPSAAPVAH
jgi:hypothetical protein